jgi:NADP-dependent 3-hydroxy acid dehydrogenase YdfG
MGCVEGKVVIVTGASAGMGRAIAVALAAEGARLGLVARRAERLEETGAQSRAAGAEVMAFPGDVADAPFAQQVVAAMVERFGGLDILVNNAGTNTFHRNLADTSAADWRRVLETNLTGAFLFTQCALPPMRKAGRGLIINISSGAGLQASAPGGVAYSAAKHGMHALTGSINAEERRHGIRSCVIAPGETDTPNLDLRPLVPTPEERTRMLTAEDIAGAVVYVAGQPDRVAVELLVLRPTVPRNYQADYERYVATGHTDIPPDRETSAEVRP